MLRYLLLGLLQDEGPDHGYGLMRRYRDLSGVTISIGNVYRELQRIGSLGWVRPVPRTEGEDPRRLPYEITQSGTAALEAWLVTPVEPGGGECQDQLALRAFVVARNGLNERGRIVLEQWREDLLMSRCLVERAREAAATRGAAAARDVAWAVDMLFVRRLDRIGIDLAFLERFIKAQETAPRRGRRQVAEGVPSKRSLKRDRRVGGAAAAAGDGQ